MSRIILSNVPVKFNINLVKSYLDKTLSTENDLKFQRFNQGDKTKSGIVKLFGNANVARCVKLINGTALNGCHLKASVLGKGPKMQTNMVVKNRGRKKKPNTQTKNSIPEAIFITTVYEILRELQSKFTKLYNLSNKTAHTLLYSITETIIERLQKVIEFNPDAMSNTFRLSSIYRRANPHSGDFKLIQSTLACVRSSAGLPPLQISENELVGGYMAADQTTTEDIPMAKLKAAFEKYSGKIVKGIDSHLENLNSNMDEPNLSKEEKEKRRVRSELKKISPYLPMLIRSVVWRHLANDGGKYRRIRIYGEPYLPPRGVLLETIKGMRPRAVTRCSCPYNCARALIPIGLSEVIASYDNVTLGDATLVIRNSDIPLYKIPFELIRKMKSLFGVDHKAGDESYVPNNDEDEAEDDELEEEQGDEIEDDKYDDEIDFE